MKEIIRWIKEDWNDKDYKTVALEIVLLILFPVIYTARAYIETGQYLYTHIKSSIGVKNE